ncbi:MAG: hypothetical protein AAFY88_05540, partial [Acidobacteriota bacterium]
MSARCTRVFARALFTASMSILVAAGPASAGSFSVAGESFGEDSILHPVGYDGTGGPLELTVCLDPMSPSSSAASATLQFAVDTWNSRAATADNVWTNAGVPPTEVDFESEALRGLGLCLGLDDPSDASGFTKATNGDNNMFQRDDGLDDVDGTRDDLRGDDGNLMWFRFLDNDPFTVAATVDSTSYARSTSVLPEGDTFAATPTRAVAAAVGAGTTEAVMVAGLQLGEAKRRLSADDVATLRYAESGLDELAGTADDYQVQLNYLGLGTVCDIPVSFDTQGTVVACTGGLQEFSPGHWRFSTNIELTFSDAVLWHFSGEGLIFSDGFESGD